MKRIIGCFVLFSVVLSTFSIAFATTPNTFKMGDNITATYSADQSVLTIEGSGKMWNYTDETCIDNQITKKIIIKEGIENISEYAFSSFAFVKEISLPEKLKTIGNSAFFATGATKITLPASVTKIGRRAFCAGDVGNLKITMLCKKAPEISEQSFINVSDSSDCIIYVKSKSVKSDLQKQFNSKNIESEIVVK